MLFRKGVYMDVLQRFLDIVSQGGDTDRRLSELEDELKDNEKDELGLIMEIYTLIRDGRRVKSTIRTIDSPMKKEAIITLKYTLAKP